MRASIAIVALAAIARLAVAGIRRLSPDEAYYLCAARTRWPIPDHPPGLGALLALADHVVSGSVELRARVVAVACQAVTALGVGALAASCAERRGRAFGWGTLLATLGLMPWVSGLVATPDAPLLACCAWLLVFANRAHRDARPIAALAPFLLAALAVASKVVALAVVAAVAFDLSRARRVVAAVAVLAGATAALPLATTSLRLQVDHALGRGPLVSAPQVGAPLAVVAAVSAAVGLFGPAVVVLAARGRARLSRIVGGSWIVLGLGAALLVSALVSGRPPEPNWIAPAMLPLYAIAGAVAAEELGRRGRGIALAVHVVPAVVGLGLWIAPDVSTDARHPLARVPRVDAGAEGLRASSKLADLPAYAAPAWSCIYGDPDMISRTSDFTLNVSREQTTRP